MLGPGRVHHRPASQEDPQGVGGAKERQLSAWAVRVRRWGSPSAILHSHQVNSDSDNDSDDDDLDDDAGTDVTHTQTVPEVMTRVQSCVVQSHAKVRH